MHWITNFKIIAIIEKMLIKSNCCLVKNCLVYNILWLDISNIFSSKIILIISKLGVFLVKELYITLFNYFHNQLLFIGIKTKVVSKCQQFDNNNGEKRLLKVYKCKQVDKNNNKEK